MMIVCGVILYDFVQNKTGFSYIDEILALIIFIRYFLNSKYTTDSNNFIKCFIVFIFYLFYSLLFPNNVIPAIWNDFFIQIKPYIVFFCTYNLNFELTQKQRKKICKLCILLSIFFLIPIGIAGINSELMTSFGGYSRFATMSIILGITYYYASEKNNKSLLITFTIWTIGLLSYRSKMYGFYAGAIGIFILWNNKNFYRKNILSIKSIIIVCLIATMILIVGWQKISYYFIQGTQAENTFARPLMYQGAIMILKDHPFLGTGFGSYATYASALYYSPLYHKYGLYLNPEVGNGLFISDTYFPALAQFGLLGITIFILFWIYLIKEAIKYYKINHNIKLLKMIILIVLCIFIESVADSTFTQNRGMAIMMLLAMFLTEQKQLIQKLHK